MTKEFSDVTQLGIAATSSILPGFKFSPDDEDLISYYLRNKMDGLEKSVDVIREVDIYNYEPWDLPAKSVIHSKDEWFFFCARGRKYPKGSQSRRGTQIGYWKAAGKERNIMSGSTVLATKRVLVFHIRLSPRGGERTEWILHEYCMTAQPADSMVVCRLKFNHQFRGKQSSPTQPQPSTSHNFNFGTLDVSTDHNTTSEELGGPYLMSSNYDSSFLESQVHLMTSNYNSSFLESEVPLMDSSFLESEVPLLSTNYDYSFPESEVHLMSSNYDSSLPESQPKDSSGDARSVGLQKNSQGEEKWFSDLLNDYLDDDNEINLDEALLATQSESERRYEQTPHTGVSHVQGTARRRLKLKTSNLKISDCYVSRRRKDDSKDSPNCILTLLSEIKRVNWRHLSVVFLVSILLIFVAVFMSWFRSVKS